MSSSGDTFKPQTVSGSYASFISQAICRGLAAMHFAFRALHQQCLLNTLARRYMLHSTTISNQAIFLLGNRSVCLTVGSAYSPEFISNYQHISSFAPIAPAQTDFKFCSVASRLEKVAFQNPSIFSVNGDRRHIFVEAVCAIYQSEMPKRKRTRSEPSRKKEHSHSEVSKRKKRSHSEPSKKRRRSERSKKKGSHSEQTTEQSHSRSSRSGRRRESEKAVERLVRRMRRQSRAAPADDGSTSPTKTRRTTKPHVQEKHSHESRRRYPAPPGFAKVEPSTTPALVDKNRQKSCTPPPGECGFTQRDFSTYAPYLPQKHTRPATPPPSKSQFSTSSVLSKENQDDGRQSTKETTGGANCDENKPMHHDRGKPKKRELHEFRRHWRDTNLGRRHKTKPYEGVDFTVVSYNVLAQQLINMNDYLYHGCSNQVLDWDFRKRNLLSEFADLNADILCLQEVQGTHFGSFYEPELRKLGYRGVFKQRTGDKCDGCATFFKDNLFDLVEYKCLEYYRPGIQLLDRDNVAVLVLLQPKSRHVSSERICVANTHLLYNPRRGDIKLTQLGMLLAEIDRLSYVDHDGIPNQSTTESHKHHPVIMCGDFNSLPESALVGFIQGGGLVYEGLRAVDVSGQEPWKNSKYLCSPLWPSRYVGVTFGCQYQSVVQQRKTASENNSSSTPNQTPDMAQSQASPETNQPSETSTKDDDWNHHGHLQHPFQFSSSYVYNDDSREVTTNHGRTNCTVDYIFHASGNVLHKGNRLEQLRILSRLSLFTDKEASEMGGLPNSRWSSDHYSLAVKFLLVPQS